MLAVHWILGGGGVKSLLLALLAAMVAVMGMTLTAGAQTDDGEAEVPQGRVIVRIQDRTDDGVDDYRIEFGFFPEWALDDKDPWAEAVTTWSDWLPRARYLTKTVLDGRADADNRRWLRSSPISVPASAAAPQSGRDADLGGGDDEANQITGRVIARYNPDSRGRLRVEFGFLPDWAFTGTANTEEAVERYGDGGGQLPRSRYLSASLISDRRGSWLRSSIDVITHEPTPCRIRPSSSLFEFGQGQMVDDVRLGTIECELTDELNPIAFTNVPRGLNVRAVYAGEDRLHMVVSGTVDTTDRTYPREYPVVTTVRPSAGDPISETITIHITESLVQRLSWAGGYSPSTEQVGGSVSFRVPSVVAGPSNPVWTYESGTTDICTVNRNSGELTLVAEGLCEITATSAAREGFREGTVQTTVRVSSAPPPPIMWQGYRPNEMAVLGGDSPPLIDPTATVDGRSVRLNYTFEVDEASDDICDVNRNSGAIEPLTAGTCLLIARSVETDEYAAAESDPVRVTITKVAPQLRWGGYEADDFGDGAPVNPEDPQPDVPEARGNLTYSYSATPSSICVVNSRTGALTPLRDGTCDITVRSAETDVFLAASVTRQAVIMNQPPTCRLRDIGPLEPGELVQIDLDTYCEDPEGGDLRYTARSDDAGVASVRTVGSSLRVTAGDAPRGDRAQIIVTATDPGGASVEARFDARVESLPAPIVRSVSCSPSSPSVNDNVTCTASLSGGDPDSYAWSGGASSGSSVRYSTSFGTAGRKTVSLTVRNNAGSDSGSTLVIVGDIPPEIVDISCSPFLPEVGASVTCTASLRGGAPTEWSWSGGDSGGSSETYSTRFSTSGDKRVSLTVRNSAGSDSDSTSLRVPVLRPEIDSISCSPSSPNVDDSVTCTASVRGDEPISYAWSGGDSSGSSARYSTSFGTAGSKTVRLDVRNARGRATQTFSVTVNRGVEPPEINSISCPTTTTVNASVTCTASVSGSEPISYAWSGGDSSGSSENYGTSFSTAGSKTVYLTVRNSAGSDSDSMTVRVDDVLPVVDSVSCSPLWPSLNASVTCTASLLGGTPNSYSWSGGASGGSSATYSTSFSTYDRHTVSLTVSNAAGSDSDSTIVRVIRPPVVLSVSCSPSSPNVNASVTCRANLSSGLYTSFSWSGGDSSGSNELYSTSFSSAGSKTVSLTVSNPVGSDSGSTTVIVGTAPVVNSVSCSPSSTSVNASVTCTASLSGGTPTSYSWSGGASSGSSASYSTSFSSAGSKTVSLTVTNSAGSASGSMTVEVIGAPVVNSVSCSPSETTVNASVSCEASLSGGTPTSYSWSGGASSGSSASYSTSFSSYGSQTVSLTVSNAAGSDSGSTTVRVIEPPVVIRISCSPSSPTVNASVTCTASLSGGTPTSYSWSGGASSGSSASYSTSFSTEGSTVRLTVSNAGGSGSGSITLLPPTPLPRVSISCSPSPTTVNASVTCEANLSGGTPTSYSWSGGASSGSSASYSTSFSSAGSKTVSLTVSNSAGSASDSTTVIVVERPVVNSVNCPSETTVNTSVSCTASLSGGTPTSYSWSGGASSGSSASYRPSFSSVGSKTVSLTVSNSAGSDSGSTTVRVIEPPRVSISCPSTTTVNTNVTCTASLSGGTPTSYSWSGGASSGSSASYRTSFSTTGSKRVSLTVSNSAGSDSDSTTVRVIEPPRVSISCPSTTTVNTNVTCTASLSGGTPTSYSWSGGASSGSSASYRTSFSTTGSKRVSLTVSNSAGSDSDSTTVRVLPDEPSIGVRCPVSVLVGSSFTCTVRNRGGPIDSYSWSGTGGASSSSSATYRSSFSSYGSQEVEVTVRNTGGSDIGSFPVNVVATPPSTNYGRCGSDRIRVYWFDRSTFHKHWLNMTWEEAVATISGWGEGLIGHLSQSACNTWTTGGALTTANYR